MGDDNRNPSFRRGFSLVEVILAFLVLSLLVMMVVGVVTSSYMMSAQLKELPNTYYRAQNEVEQEMDKLKKLVTEKYRIQNELLNVPEIDPELSTRLSDINSQLSGYESSPVALFGKSVDVFDFKMEYVSPGGRELTLYAGVANTERLERPVPIIDKVTINVNGAPVENDVYNGIGAMVNVSVDYNSKNYGYYYRDLYQWFLCTGDFHTANYPSDDGQGELLYGTVFAQYPNDFTLIPSANGPSITIDSSYAGKFLLCVATPLSIEGKMGSPVISNYLYISGLPALSAGSYKMVLEPSITTYDYDPSNLVRIDQILSRKPAGGRLLSVGTTRPAIDLSGAVTDTSLSASLTGRGNFSRYISFYSGSMMRASDFYSAGTTTLFAVVRNGEGTEVDFIRSGLITAGFATHSFSSGGGGDTGWQILEAALPSNCSEFELGGCKFDAAELIVVSNASGSDRTAIRSYLSGKYHITF